MLSRKSERRRCRQNGKRKQCSGSMYAPITSGQQEKITNITKSTWSELDKPGESDTESRHGDTEKEREREIENKSIHINEDNGREALRSLSL